MTSIKPTALLKGEGLPDYDKITPNEITENIPKLIKELNEKLDEILQPVHNAMFVESNPSPVKYGAKLMNLCDDEVRLPLVKVSDNAKIIIKKALESAKLI